MLLHLVCLYFKCYTLKWDNKSHQHISKLKCCRQLSPKLGTAKEVFLFRWLKENSSDGVLFLSSRFSMGGVLVWTPPLSWPLFKVWRRSTGCVLGAAPEECIDFIFQPEEFLLSLTKALNSTSVPLLTWLPCTTIALHCLDAKHKVSRGAINYLMWQHGTVQLKTTQRTEQITAWLKDWTCRTRSLEDKETVVGDHTMKEFI